MQIPRNMNGKDNPLKSTISVTIVGLDLCILVINFFPLHILIFNVLLQLFKTKESHMVLNTNKK